MLGERVDREALRCPAYPEATYRKVRMQRQGMLVVIFTIDIEKELFVRIVRDWE